MTIRLSAEGVRLVLLDIEGTTTPITFVYDVLFPHARRHLRAFLREQATSGSAVHDVVDQLRDEHHAEQEGGVPAWPDGSDATDAAGTYAEWLMERDRKSPALKSLQGMIWERGYGDGELRGDVFDDVPPALGRWKASEIGAAIYSSGSVLAQRLLFSTTRFGDLTAALDGFFDTAVGPKREAESYRTIARALKLEPRAILFVSDVSAELVAARDAGCQVVLCVRPENPTQPDAAGFRQITTFDQLEA